MKKTIYSSGSKIENILGSSRAIKIGNLIKVAGTAGIYNGDPYHCSGNASEQTEQCIKIIKKVIEEAGGSLNDVVRTRVMLTKMDDWEEVAEVHHRYFSEIRPVCTVMEVNKFIIDKWKVEIEVDCIIGENMQWII